MSHYRFSGLLNVKSNKYKASGKVNGFTIVELLIVIVVIGILAAISIVSYNGTQARSQMAQKKTAIASIEKQSSLLAAEASRYPNASEMEEFELDENVEIRSSIWENYEYVYSKSNVYATRQVDPSTVTILYWDNLDRVWKIKTLRDGVRIS